MPIWCDRTSGYKRALRRRRRSTGRNHDRWQTFRRADRAPSSRRGRTKRQLARTLNRSNGRKFFGRIVGGIFVLLGVSVLIFLLARVIPGDPARLALGPAAPPAQVEALREQLGLNEPVVVQYFHYIRQAFVGDFGISLYTNRPVIVDLRDTFPATLELVLVAMLFVAGAVVPLGALSAMHRHSWTDRVIKTLSIFAVTTPTFVWAVLFMLIFGFWLELFPIAGRLSEWLLPPTRITGLYVVDAALTGSWGHLVDALHHLILPAFALSLPALGQTARITRTSMDETHSRPYIDFARSYGISKSKISFKYALRPGSLPALTIIGLEVVALLGNAFLVETVFMWPGLARYGVDTILYKDLNGMMATILVMTVFFVIVNAFIDILATFVDPRIRFGART